MKKGIQLVALLLTVVMSSCTGGKDKAAVKQEDEKPRVKVADVTARPVDQIQDYTATVEAEVKNNIAPSSPVLELNSSQVSLTQAQLTYNQSIYDYLGAKADLDQVLGKQ